MGKNKKIKLTEEDKFKIYVDKETLSDRNKTKELVNLSKKNKGLEFELDSNNNSNKQSMSSMLENDGLNDNVSLTYLSNVVDSKTGKVSQPFVINNKKYQMVRALNNNNEKTLGVYCFDETNENGDNIIYSSDYFEENIAKPIKEKLESQTVNKTDDYTLGLSEYKHYIVNNKSGKFRKFKTIEELARATMSEDEKYMGIKEFKKFFEGKVFGYKKNIVSEISPNGEETEEEMSIKAKKLMNLIQKRIPTNIIDTIKTPIAQREVIAAFAEMIGVPRNGLSSLLSTIKDVSKNEITENKIVKIKDLLQ